MNLSRVALVIAFIYGARTASADEIVRCVTQNASEITLQLNSKRAFGRMLSCIEGDFIEDMEPCAPNGGFGLSYPTGSAQLAKVVYRWQDYGDHLGGVASYKQTPSKIMFSGGFMSPDQGYRPQWNFVVDRLTGAGRLRKFDQEGKADGKLYEYNCASARRKF